jgi:hypothetical protein
MTVKPPSPAQRWTARRKAELVEAIDEGRIGEATAMRQYNLSWEELSEWRRNYEVHGKKGLRATRVQQYRKEGRRQQ